MTSALCLNSCVCGYHVYSEMWTAVFGEILCTERKLHNVVDRYVMAVTKDSGETVGYVTRKFSRLCRVMPNIWIGPYRTALLKYGLTDWTTCDNGGAITRY